MGKRHKAVQNVNILPLEKKYFEASLFFFIKTYNLTAIVKYSWKQNSSNNSYI